MDTRTNIGRAACCAVVALAAAALPGCGGGPPAQLEVKGLRLGMPLEEAARAMLENGSPPFGSMASSTWTEETFRYPEDIFSRAQTGVREEYRLAKRAHDIAWFEAAAADGRVPDLRSYFESQGGGRLSYADQDIIERFSLNDIPAFVDGWYDTHGSSPLLPAGERFQGLRDYVEERYPDGPTYAVGGPWTGAEPLELAEDGQLKGAGWALAPGADGRVERITLDPSAVDALFNAGDLTAGEFVQSFIDAYGIPQMAFYADDVNPIVAQHTGEFFKTGWAYVDRGHGWAVTVSENKKLVLSRATASSETAFD